MKKTQQLGLLFMTISAIGLAIGTILMKLIPVKTDLAPTQVAVWRFAIAAPLMWLFTAAGKKKVALGSKQIWRLIGMGVVFSAASLLALLSLGRLSSSTLCYPGLHLSFPGGCLRSVDQTPRLPSVVAGDSADDGWVGSDGF